MYGSEEIELIEKEILIRENVIEQYNSSYSVESCETVSDVYGGVTNLILFETSGYRHNRKNNLGEYDYWYKQNGQSTGAQSKEFVAIYFSQQMSGDLETIENTKAQFPQACELMEEMFAYLKTEIESE